MFEEFHSLNFFGERINSRRYSRSCVITANWPKNGGLIDEANASITGRAGIVNYFFQKSVVTERGRVTVVMACVVWLQLHPHDHLLGHQVEL